MNQGKLEVIKQEMARLNVDILGISKLKWTGMGEFNSDDHYIYYCGQESLRRKWSSHHSKQKSPKCRTWMQSQKRQNDLCSFSRHTIQYHINPSLRPKPEKAMAPRSSTFAWKIPWMEEPGRLQSMGSLLGVSSNRSCRSS